MGHGCECAGGVFDRYIKPAFGSQTAVVYVLPETRPVSAFFNIADGAPATFAAGT